MKNYIAWLVRFDNHNSIAILLADPCSLVDALLTAQQVTLSQHTVIIENFPVHGPDTTLPRYALFFNAIPTVDSLGNLKIAHFTFSLFDNTVVVERKDDNDFTVYT